MDALTLIAVLAAYFVLQSWLLPKFGVPTCAVPQPRRSARQAPDARPEEGDAAR